MSVTALRPQSDPHAWNGWFLISEKIGGQTPKEAERFLVWVPAVAADDWRGGVEVAWWGATSGPEGTDIEERIDGEWRYVQAKPGVPLAALNNTEPTHWQLLPGPPAGIVH